MIGRRDQGEDHSGRFERVAIAAGIAAVLLWLAPYGWPNGSHGQEVLPIMAMLDASLFTRDFAVQSFLGPTPRMAYQMAIAALARGGLAIPAAYFVLQAATLFLAALAAVRMVRIISAQSERDSRWLAPALAFWFAASNHRGWNVPLLDAGAAVPSTFAVGLVLMGWALAIERRWAPAFVAFAIATLLQILVGMLPVLLLAPILIDDARRSSWFAGERRRLGAAMGVWVASAAIVALSSLSTDGPPVDAGEVLRIFGHVRAPHHWLPSAAGTAFWTNQLLLGASGAALAFITPRDGVAGRLRSFTVVVVAMTAVALTSNHLFVERLPVLLIAKLQLQRTLPFAQLAILVLLAWHVHLARITDRLLLVPALIFAPLSGVDGAAVGACVVSLIAGQHASIRVKFWLDGCALMVIGALATLPPPWNYAGAPRSYLFVAVILLLAITGPRLSTNAWRRLAGTGALIACVVTAVAALAPRRPASVGRLLRNAPAVDNTPVLSDTLRAVAALLREATPTSALVLTPPLASFELLGLLSERSVVLSWKNVPYSDAAILTWGSRLDALLGERARTPPSEPTVESAWRLRSPQELESLARSFGAEYILSRDGSASSRRLVGRTHGWTLWSVGDSRLPP
jgi:hypothetical protein